MTNYSLYEQETGKTFKGGTSQDQGGVGLCFDERVDLELSVGSWLRSTPSAGINLSS
jgi:hypothetical protein